MKSIRKILAGILIFSMMFTLIPAVTKNVQTQAANSFSVTAPYNGQLVAAGYIDIQWNAATKGNVRDYDVYINDERVTTTTNTVYTYYTTQVITHQVYVEAHYTDGSSEKTSTSTFGVSKKGLALATDMGRNISLRDMGVAWYYNWDETPSSGAQYQGIEYVPMVWKETSANNLKNRVNSAKNKGYKYVLTFNEPDLPDQCNMSVDAVWNAWQGLNDVSGIRVASPVAALWPQASPDWFQKFMDKVKETQSYDADFITIHCYPDNYGGAGMASWFLENVIDWTWEKYHKPIWITEFSTKGEHITATGGNGTKEFWEAVMPELDKRSYVERYAAFDFNDAKTGLWMYGTGALTAAGEIYRDYGNPQGFNAEEPDYKTNFRNQNTLLDNNVTENNVVLADYANESGVSASASSSFNGNKPEFAIDESVDSRWESEQGQDPQSFTLDLGTNRNIKRIDVLWEAASAAEYTIEVSTDGNSYTQVAKVSSSTGARVDSTVLKQMVNGRYVKINGTARTTQYGYSIRDIAVYGTDNKDVDVTTAKPTTTPKPTTTKAPVTSNQKAQEETEFTFDEDETGASTPGAAEREELTGPSYDPGFDPSALDYTPLHCTDNESLTLDFAIQSSTIDGFVPAYTDNGNRLTLTYSTDYGAPASITVNGEEPAEGVIVEQGSGFVKVDPTTLNDNDYTIIKVTTENNGEVTFVIRKGNPPELINPGTDGSGTPAPGQDYTDETTSAVSGTVTTAAPTAVQPTTAPTTAKVQKPAKAKVKKVAAKKKSAKKVKITIQKISAKGYQVAIYKTKKDAKKNRKALKKKFVKKAKVTITSKKLKNKKTLYVKIRAYNLDGKKKVYGAWSKVKKIKVK